MKSENMSFHEAICTIKDFKLSDRDIEKLLDFYTKRDLIGKRIAELLKIEKNLKHPFHV